MTSTLRRILNALWFPFRVVARWLRVHPAAVASMIALLAVITMAAVAIGTGTNGAARAATTPQPAVNKAESSSSDLRKAIATRTIKSATLFPARAKVNVVLKSGAKYTVGYSPTDETLADRLAAAGAKVDVNTRTGFPFG